MDTSTGDSTESAHAQGEQYRMFFPSRPVLLDIESQLAGTSARLFAVQKNVGQKLTKGSFGSSLGCLQYKIRFSSLFA